MALEFATMRSKTKFLSKWDMNLPTDSCEWMCAILLDAVSVIPVTAPIDNTAITASTKTKMIRFRKVIRLDSRLLNRCFFIITPPFCVVFTYTHRRNDIRTSP